MSEKEQAIKEKLEHSGLFDFKGLYSYAHTWFKERRFGVTEEKYKEKNQGSSKNIEIEWKITKNLSDYFKAEYKVKFEIEDLVDVEAEIDGQKKKMNQGKVVIEVSGNLIKDWGSKWESTAFSRFFRDAYNKFIIPARVHTMKDEVEDNGKSFKEAMKEFLDLTGRR